MAETVADSTARRKTSGEDVLNAATKFWFAILVLGQGLFLYFILSFYAPGMIAGDLEAWNRHPLISDPYVDGDPLGNVAFAAHIVLAAIITLGGTMQLIPWLRARAIAVHRWNGRLFMIAAIGAGLSGLYAVWGRSEERNDIVSDVSITLNAVLLFLFAGLAWRAAAMRRIDAHSRWALRTFVVTNGVFFLRFGFGGWIVVTQASPSLATFHLFAFLSYLLPLAVTELYLRAKVSSNLSQFLVAGLVLAATGYLAVGFLGFHLVFMQPILGAATL